MYKLLKQAFTLIELLVVIAIIGILSGLIIVSLSGMTQKATIAKAQVFSNSLRNSLLMNIAGEWKMDEGSGTAANDTWTKTNNATLYNFANTTAGYGDTNADGWMSSSNCISGSCLKFDGVDDYVSVTNSTSINMANTITISFWVKTGNTDWETVIGKHTSFGNPAGSGTGWAISTRSDGYASVWFRDSLGVHNTAGDQGIAFNNNVWNNVVVTYDSPYLKEYINGVNVKTWPAVTLGDFSNSSDLYLMCGYGYVNGSMDDVRIYNAAMPTSQIKEEYYAGLNSLLSNGGITREEYLSRINSIASK